MIWYGLPVEWNINHNGLSKVKAIHVEKQQLNFLTYSLGIIVV